MSEHQFYTHSIAFVVGLITALTFVSVIIR